MKDDKTHKKNNVLKVAGYILLGIAILLAAIRLSLKTSPVLNFARGKVVSLVNDQLNAELSISELNGDLWKKIVLTGISLNEDGTEVVRVDTLSAEYDLLSYFSDVFQIESIKVSGADALIEKQDTLFNFESWMKPGINADEAEEGEPFYFAIRNYGLKDSRLKVIAPDILPDSTLAVERINIEGDLLAREEFQVNVYNFGVSIKEGRLPQPVDIAFKGSLDGSDVSLSDLVINSGRSLLKGKARYDLNTQQTESSAQSDPLSYSDIENYIENELPDGGLSLSLSVNGNWEDFSVTLKGSAPGLDSLSLTTLLSFKDSLVIKRSGLDITGIDLGKASGNKVQGKIASFKAGLSGTLADEILLSEAKLDLKIRRIEYEDYFIPEVTFDGLSKSGNASGKLRVELQDGAFLEARPEIKELNEEAPLWSSAFRVRNLNMASLLNDKALESLLSFDATANGKGFTLSEKRWNYKIISADSGRLEQFIAGQDFSKYSASGWLNEVEVYGKSNIDLERTGIELVADIKNYTSENAAWDVKLQSRNLNLEDFAAVDSFATAIKLQASANGAGFDPEMMRAQGNIRIDSSIVNGARFNLLQSSFDLQNGILRIPDGVIESDILTGTFNARKNLVDKQDIDNRLQGDFRLVDLQPLAPLVGIDRLSASGDMIADINENENGLLEFSGELDLTDVVYSDLFLADILSGNTNIVLSDSAKFGFDLDISGPEITGIPLQDISFKSTGLNLGDSTNADFNLSLNSSRGSISQTGKLDLLNEESISAEVIWTLFQIKTRDRTLDLDQDFTLDYKDGALSSDTLKLSSADGAYLRSSIARLDSVNQDIWLQGMSFDFGVILELLTGQRYVDGILSGEASVNRGEDKLSAYARLQLDELKYQDIRADKLELILDIGKERLVADGGLWINGARKIIGDLDIPFVLNPPENEDAEFFDSGVRGSLLIDKVDLEVVKTLLDDLGYTNTSGIVQLAVDLDGTAGDPELSGDLELFSPTLSGIRIDSARINFDYQHLQQRIVSKAIVRAAGQQAAKMDAVIPFNLDIAKREFNPPGDEDSLSIDLVTDNFNLSVFNDFLDKEYSRNLKGMLNASVNIAGTVGDLSPKGFVKLTRSEVEVPIAGIKLDNISSDLEFNAERLILKEFRMGSGGGVFRASGNIGLDGVMPDDLDLKLSANQFKMANTRNENLVADLKGSLKGNLFNPVAEGEFTVRNGFVVLSNFGEKTVENVLLDEEEAKLSSFSFYDSLAIDMVLKIDRNFFVRNLRAPDLEIELTGALDIQKSQGEDLQLFGQINAEDGYVKPIGKRFNVTEGRFVFSGPADNPDLSVKTKYEPNSPEIEEIRYIITGTAREPQFTFESEPYMEQQDIVCYTFFGEPCAALDSWQQVFSGQGGNSATNLFAEVLLDEIETLATQELGIDVVQIDNTSNGSETGTSIKTGWYLNRRTFFAIINEITNNNPDLIFLLEYMINERLDLILTQGNRLREGVDLRWKFDY